MQTDTILAFQVEHGDTLLFGELTYLIQGEPTDDGDFLLFDTRDEDGEVTQLPMGPFDVVQVVTVFDETSVDDLLDDDSEV